MSVALTFARAVVALAIGLHVLGADAVALDGAPVAIPVATLVPAVSPGTTSGSAPRSDDRLNGYDLFIDVTFDEFTTASMRAVGARPYTIVYEYVDSKSRATGRINASRVREWLLREIGRDSTAWVELDFEVPFLDVLRSDKDAPEFAATVTHLVSVFDHLKAEFPNAKFTMYDVPGLPYWVTEPGGKVASWPNASAVAKKPHLERLDAMRPLLDRFDWFIPSFYDWAENSRIRADWREGEVKAQREWKRDIVRTIRAYLDSSANPDRRILPTVYSRWVDRGRASIGSAWRPIPIEEYLDDQIRPALDAGADGIKIWSHGDRYNFDNAFAREAGGNAERIADGRKYLTADDGITVGSWTSPTSKTSAWKQLGTKNLAYVNAIAEEFRRRAPRTPRGGGAASPPPPAGDAGADATPPSGSLPRVTIIPRG